MYSRSEGGASAVEPMIAKLIGEVRLSVGFLFLPTEELERSKQKAAVSAIIYPCTTLTLILFFPPLSALFFF